VEGALIDTYVAADNKDMLFNDGVIVNRLLDKSFGYGVVLSGAAVNIEKRCDTYFKKNIKEIYDLIEDSVKKLEVTFAFL
jgi:hypothetical protein